MNLPEFGAFEMAFEIMFEIMFEMVFGTMFESVESGAANLDQVQQALQCPFFITCFSITSHHIALHRITSHFYRISIASHHISIDHSLISERLAGQTELTKHSLTIVSALLSTIPILLTVVFH